MMFRHELDPDNGMMGGAALVIAYATILAVVYGIVCVAVSSITLARRDVTS